jgi:hypothetical protein
MKSLRFGLIGRGRPGLIDAMRRIRDLSLVLDKHSGGGSPCQVQLQEYNMPIPTEPVVFMKATSCLSGPNDPIMLPRGSVKTDGNANSVRLLAELHDMSSGW